MKNKKIIVQGVTVNYFNDNNEDYICISDIARFKGREIRIADIINGIPNPTEYNNIKMTPFNTSCSLAINNNAELKNVPIHGVQLIENNTPNNIALKKLKFFVSIFFIFDLFKNPIFKRPM